MRTTMNDTHTKKAFEAAKFIGIVGFGAGFCVFRSNSATISDSNRPLIPIDFGHPFRSNSATL